MKQESVVTFVSFFCKIMTFFLAFLFLCNAYVLPRNPVEPYASLEEEYIAAIEEFINSGKIIVPEGANFHYDNEIIKIIDIKSNASVTCRFVLDNTVPVYKWSFNAYNATFFAKTLFIIIFFALIYVAICKITNSVIGKLNNIQNCNALNTLKSSATYGDSRILNASHEIPDCNFCEKNTNCKCIRCMYLGLCGNCPTTDCEDTFEEKIFEVNNSSENSRHNDSNDNITPEEWDAFMYNPASSASNETFKKFMRQYEQFKKQNNDY